MPGRKGGYVFRGAYCSVVCGVRTQVIGWVPSRRGVE